MNIYSANQFFHQSQVAAFCTNKILMKLFTSNFPQKPFLVRNDPSKVFYVSKKAYLTIIDTFVQKANIGWRHGLEVNSTNCTSTGVQLTKRYNSITGDLMPFFLASGDTELMCTNLHMIHGHS